MPPRATHRLPGPFVASWLVAGAMLRFFQYFHNRAVFIDEAALAVNLRDRSLTGLLQPLEYAQSAPIGFLWLQKLILLVLGPGEYALRATTLLAGLAALPLFFALARRVLPAHLVTAAVAWFAWCSYLVYWSSDMKPYALDVLASLVLILLAARHAERRDGRSALELGVAGAVAPWFSYASVLVLAGFGAWLCLRAVRDRDAGVLRPAPLWLGAVPAVWHGLTSLSPAARRYFDSFWADGFLQSPAAPGALVQYVRRWLGFLYDPVGLAYWLPLYIAVTIAMAVGVAWMAKRKPGMAMIVMAPVAVTLMASFAGAYPVGARWTYSGRVVLFLVPAAILAAIGGFARVRQVRLARLLAGMLVAVVAWRTVATLPVTRGDVREALAYVERNAHPDDVVYLYYGIRQAVDYYRPRLPARTVNGVCAQADRQKYLEDMGRLRGNPRVWVVLGYDLYLEREMFMVWLGSNAIQLDSTDLRLADARLYDFSELGDSPVPAALMTPPVRPDEGTDCEGIFDFGSSARASEPPSHASLSHLASSASDGRLPVDRMPIR